MSYQHRIEYTYSCDETGHIGSHLRVHDLCFAISQLHRRGWRFVLWKLYNAHEALYTLIVKSTRHANPCKCNFVTSRVRSSEPLQAEV